MVASIEEIHPELFHYTGLAGLEGIIKSQTLWATHAAFLNDQTEIRAFRARLPSFLRPKVEAGLAELIRRVPANQTLIEQRGGMESAVDEIVNGFASGMFNALLGTDDTPPFVEPFITSFCTAETPDISQHGLLSQWRGYGQEGGYAIVFDTVQLVQLLKAEADKWKYDLFGGDVIYSSATDAEILAEFGENLDIVATVMAEWIKTPQQPPESLENVYYPLIQVACRYKHWGFHEEKEVRVIAALPNKELFEAQRAMGLVEMAKSRQHFARNGILVPYIHLFEGITSTLPISRIIVGPHRDKNKRRQAIESLLSEYNLYIPVVVSEIPYVT